MRHTFTVVVDGCTKEQAEQVMVERINYDEEMPDKFEYEIGFWPDSPSVYRITEADIEATLNRPLCPGEASSMAKTLGMVTEDALSALDAHEPPTADLRADGIASGQYIREYGMGDWIYIDEVGQHGDTMLITGHDHNDNVGVEFTLDRDTVVELLTINTPEEEK